MAAPWRSMRVATCTSKPALRAARAIGRRWEMKYQSSGTREITRGAGLGTLLAGKLAFAASGDCIRELRDRADDVIEAGCPRRLEDKDVVGHQSIEPHALRRRGEKAPQSFDGRGDLVVGAPAREIGTNPFGLRPQARDGIVDAAVGKDGV